MRIPDPRPIADPRPATVPAGLGSRETDTLGALVALVASGQATTRASLARLSGLSRSTVAQRISTLLDEGLLVETGNATSSGGRPAAMYAVNPDAGLVLAAELGATHCQLAVSDLSGQTLSESIHGIDINDGPERILGLADDGFRRLLDRIARPPEHVRAIGLGVPGPVEFSTGTVVRPPIMRGWDGYRTPGFFAHYPEVPVLVDNDVNIMALGEYWSRNGNIDPLLFIKIGTGIGCGIIIGGRVHRGADGAAGDIGHIRVPDHETVVCQCGNTGCVEAVAGGAAIARALQQEGLKADSARDVVRLAQAGNIHARRAVRVASQRIGEVAASLVSFYNPACIVVGGALAELSEDLLADLRSVVYRRALPLATRSLRIEISHLGGRAGIVGATVLALQEALSPRNLGSMLRTRTRAGASG
jgi:glucokinase-like ROK family protein